MFAMPQRHASPPHRQAISVSLDRRAFVKTGVSGLGALWATGHIPTRVVPWRKARPVRVRGRVAAAGRGVAGVAVSDGSSVVATGADGTYELITDTRQAFVFCSVPSGYRIPTSQTGTAQHYVPLGTGSDERQASFDLVPLTDNDEQHTFLLLADVQTQDGQEMGWFHQHSVPDIRQFVQEQGDREVFGIACGDIMFDDLSLYPEFERGVRDLGVPFFQVVGNHDLDQDGGSDLASTATFCNRFGPRYYSFNRGAVHYVVLDDVLWHGAGYIGYVDDDQLAWLANDLRQIESGRTVVVALHIPVLGSRHVREGQRSPSNGISVTNRDRLYRLLEPYRAHVLAGHTHESEHVFENGVHEHVVGAVCGAWWSGPICADGTPSGYGVYEINGEDVTWRYKATGHPFDHQLRVYPAGIDPAAPDEIVANVWDWDPQWTVVWYEGGDRRGQMARRTGRDPLSVELHLGPELPPRRKWVDPYPTSHLFYAPAGRSGQPVTVEATDRFGRVYQEELTQSADRPSP
jgi:hypothetical protein